MAPVFTDYARRLDPSGEPPDPESFARVWLALRRLAERELRQRGLWEASPTYLGVFGRVGWRDDRDAAGGDGLEELVAELYSFIFIDRLARLLDHLRLKPTIDGLVVLNVRHLLHERQKKHDPLGYRVFAMCHQAVTQAVSARELFVLFGDARVRNSTVLGCRPDLPPDQVLPLPDGVVTDWNDGLMPALVKSKGRAREQVIADLRALIGKLPSGGIEGFVFHELLDPIKSDARLRWALHLSPHPEVSAVDGDLAEEGRGAIVPAVSPDLDMEDRDSLEQLSQCLAGALDRLLPGRAREDLKRLWRSLQDHAHDGEIPSRRKLAEELGLPRRRLVMLFRTLGELVEDCRRARFATPITHAAVVAGGDTMSKSRSARALRKATGQARHRYAEQERGRQADGEPRVGDVFALAASAQYSVEWLLLEDRDDGFCAVPADMSPLMGPGDWAVPASASGGPWTLRCTFDVMLARENLDLGARRGSVSADAVEQVMASMGSLHEEVIDPELVAWIQEVVKPACRAVGSGRATPSQKLPFRSKQPTRRSWLGSRGLALAAAILLSLGLGLSLGRLWQQAGGTEAVSNVPYHSLHFSTDGGRSRFDQLTLPAEAQEIVLLLNVTAVDQRFERYRLRVWNQATDLEVWESGDLMRVKGDTLSVKLPTRLIPAGSYQFRLLGLREDEIQPVAEQSLRIEVK